MDLGYIELAHQYISVGYVRPPILTREFFVGALRDPRDTRSYSGS